MKMSFKRGILKASMEVDEVDSALEQLSPSASLIRNARLNW